MKVGFFVHPTPWKETREKLKMWGQEDTKQTRIISTTEIRILLNPNPDDVKNCFPVSVIHMHSVIPLKYHQDQVGDAEKTQWSPLNPLGVVFLSRSS